MSDELKYTLTIESVATNTLITCTLNDVQFLDVADMWGKANDREVFLKAIRTLRIQAFASPVVIQDRKTGERIHADRTLYLGKPAEEGK